jgi:hypothetical protein
VLSLLCAFETDIYQLKRANKKDNARQHDLEKMDSLRFLSVATRQNTSHETAGYNLLPKKPRLSTVPHEGHGGT